MNVHTDMSMAACIPLEACHVVTKIDEAKFQLVRRVQHEAIGQTCYS